MLTITRALALSCLVACMAVGSVSFAAVPKHKAHSKMSKTTKAKPNKAKAMKMKPHVGKG